MVQYLTEDFCGGEQCIMTSRTELSLQIGFLAHLALAGPTTPIIALEPEDLFDLTPEAALQSPIVGDRSKLPSFYLFSASTENTCCIAFVTLLNN